MVATRAQLFARGFKVSFDNWDTFPPPVLVASNWVVRDCWVSFPGMYLEPGHRDFFAESKKNLSAALRVSSSPAWASGALMTQARLGRGLVNAVLTVLS